MKIIFNALGCGLGNNGGTNTIVQSAKALELLGHKIYIDYRTNNYTWDDILKKPGIRNDIDCLIDVSVWDIDITAFVYNYYFRVWWMRGWETWVYGEKALIEKIKNYVDSGNKIIVNSSWLVKQLKEKCDVDACLCYAGLDFGSYYHYTSGYMYSYHSSRYSSNSVNEIKDGYIHIGHLGPRKHKIKRYDICQQLHSVFKEKVIWHELGENLCGEYQLGTFYGRCNIWIAPTELEGFHNCPAEANLCGALVCCNKMPSNGMGDYATDETAMRFNTYEKLLEAIEKPDFSKVEKMQDVLINKIGSREKNMKRFIEILEKG